MHNLLYTNNHAAQSRVAEPRKEVMSQLTIKNVAIRTNAVQTISTIDLRAMVNAARAVAGEEEIRNDNFILKVEDELEGELNLPEKR